MSGVQLDVHKQVMKEFSQTQMFIYDHYIMIEAIPVMRERLIDQLNQITDDVKMFINSKKDTSY